MEVLGGGVVAWLLFGIISAIVASNKGRSGCGWFLLGVLLGPFGLILALVVSKNQNTDTPDRLPSKDVETLEVHSKKCPACAEEIKLEAKKCRFCGERFDPDEVSKEVAKVKKMASLDDRLLCSDGTCVGIIGLDGKCEVCGKPYDSEKTLPVQRDWGKRLGAGT